MTATLQTQGALMKEAYGRRAARLPNRHAAMIGSKRITNRNPDVYGPPRGRSEEGARWQTK